MANSCLLLLLSIMDCTYYRCYTFIRLAMQYFCLHQHLDKHVSNALYYHILTAMTSPDDRNFSAPLLSYETPITVVVCR